MAEENAAERNSAWPRLHFYSVIEHFEDGLGKGKCIRMDLNCLFFKSVCTFFPLVLSFLYIYMHTTVTQYDLPNILFYMGQIFFFLRLKN